MIATTPAKAPSKTQYYTASTLNGFIADEHHSLDWLFQFGEVESMKDHYPRFISDVGALAMGAHTYEWVLRHENLVQHPEKWPYTQPTWVFSRRNLPRLPGADIRFVSGDVTSVHAEMTRAAAGKNLWVVGGGELAGQFLDSGLLDEIIVTLAPVLLRSGAPLLPRNLSTPPMRLKSVETFDAIYATLTYEIVRQAEAKNTSSSDHTPKPG